jgi:hypothetical protein
VSSFEDRIVQDRASQILQAIWEPEFRDCSYGFRPGRNAHQALKRLAQVITVERTQWVVEADIKGFFDHVTHSHVLRFLAHRIADPRSDSRFGPRYLLFNGYHRAAPAALVGRDGSCGFDRRCRGRIELPEDVRYALEVNCEVTSRAMKSAALTARRVDSAPASGAQC